MFAAAKEKRKQEKEEQNNRGSWSSEYENTYWASLQTDNVRVFRIIGYPLSDRQSGTDPKRINLSKIRSDNGSQFYCIFPDHKSNPDWILWKIYDLVTDGSFTGSGKSRHKEYKYQQSHPECFRRVVYNNTEGNAYEKGWTPQTKVIMNVIDRMDPEFHKQTRHSKLLSSKCNPIKDKPGNFWYDWGVPIACYNTIWDEVVEYAGDWADYDIGIKKLDDTPFYMAYHGTNDAHKMKEVSKYVAQGPMTPEEEAYELYDLDEMFAVTSYTKIKAKLGQFIKKVDTDFGMNFSTELDLLVQQEQAKWKAEGKNQFGYKPSEKKAPEKTPGAMPYDSFTDSEDPIPAYVPDTADTAQVADRQASAPTRVAPVEINWAALADGSFNGTKYLGVPLMTDAEKAMVIGINEDGSFKYQPGLEILKNTKNQFMSPEAFHVDPLSGEVWMAI